MTTIKTVKEYFETRGLLIVEPLINPLVNIDIETRVNIQRELFGKPTPRNDDKFFRYAWKIKPGICEETNTPLQVYSAVHISHILTKGGHPDMRYDLRNYNKVVKWVHTIWENGTDKERKKLKIYWRNQKTIQMLINDYQKL